METLFRGAVLDWLRADPALAENLNAIADESPVTASIPWLGIAASASMNWGVKGAAGREIRLALELQTRGDDAAATEALSHTIQRRIDAMPSVQDGFAAASIIFLRSRAEKRRGNIRAVLLEYRFRILSTHSET